MNNITVKKADGTTNVVYVAKRGASASAPALYTLDASASIAAFRARIAIIDRVSNGPKAQKVEVQFTYPVTALENGVTVLKGNIPISAVFTVPLTLSDADIAEAVAQFGNLIVSPELQGSFRSGFAPR